MGCMGDSAVATGTLISVSEYLNTTYRPDCDFLEGQVLERNLGESPHAKLQNYFLFTFTLNRKAWGVRVLPEQRVQVKPLRYRIPDVCIARSSDPDDRIIRVAPLLCIEVLSSNDTMADMRQRAEDYRVMGVAHIWAADPWKLRAYLYGEDRFAEPDDGVLRIPETPIAVALTDLFAELDAQ